MTETHTTLATALRAAAAELGREAPPPALLARIHAALPAAQPTARTAGQPGGGAAAPGRRRGLSWRLPPALSRGAAWSMACATVLVGSLVLMLQPAPPPFAETVTASGFVPLLPPERWPAARGEAAPAWLVSAELSGERLAALGLPYDPAHAGERVRAELLMHASGDVLAVRLLR